MKYSNRIAALFCLLPLALLASGVQAAVATLERLSGQPVIYQIGDAGARQVSLPKLGAQYTLPIEIETGFADSVMFRLPDSDVSVAPGTIMRIAAPVSQDGGLLQRVLQKAGSALFSVDRQSVEHFEVDTPYLVSVVKGTMFTVVVHDSGATVSLHEGRLQVNSPDGNQGVELFPGDVAFAGQDGFVEKLQHTLTRHDAGSAPLLERSAAGADDSVDHRLTDLATVSADGNLALQGSTVAGMLGDAVAADGFADAVGGSADLGGDIVLNIDAGAGDLGADLGDTGDDLVADLGDTAGDLVGDLGDTAGDLVGDLGDTAGDLVGDLGGSAGDLVGDLGGSAGDLLGDLTGSTGDLVGDLTGGTGDLLGDVTDDTGDLLGDVGDTLGDTTGDLTGTVGDLTGDLLGTGDLTGDTGSTGGTGGVGGLLGGLGGGLGL